MHGLHAGVPHLGGGRCRSSRQPPPPLPVARSTRREAQIQEEEEKSGREEGIIKKKKTKCAKKFNLAGCCSISSAKTLKTYCGLPIPAAAAESGFSRSPSEVLTFAEKKE